MQFKTSLMAHQEAAVQKLNRTKVGALFMGMGTGKSRTIMEIAARRQKRISRAIWFCPVTLRETVHQELFKHIDNPSVYVFDDNTNLKNVPRDKFWYVVGIESMSQSKRVILTAAALTDASTMVIVDESTYIKNYRAQRTEWITRLGEKARYRFVMTGTSFTQGIIDLYGQMKFLSWEILGYRSYYSFEANHIEYSKKRKGMIVRAHNTALIAAKIAPYVYQVTKEECLDLPEKIYVQRYCTMTRQQSQTYDRAKQEILSEIDLWEGDWWETACIFRMLTALKTVVCGFWNRREWRGREAGEVEKITFPHNRIALLAHALNEIPDGEKAIIWTQFHHCADQIAACIATEFPGDGYELFTGNQTPAVRNQNLERWRPADGPRFLIATDCGGHGLTLNEAAYVVHYDTGFKLSQRMQQEDRCHRIGQTRQVTYIDLICSNSIDVRIHQALWDKTGLLARFTELLDKVKDVRGRKEALKRMIDEL